MITKGVGGRGGLTGRSAWVVYARGAAWIIEGARRAVRRSVEASILIDKDNQLRINVQSRESVAADLPKLSG